MVPSKPASLFFLPILTGGRLLPLSPLLPGWQVYLPGIPQGFLCLLSFSEQQ